MPADFVYDRIGSGPPLLLIHGLGSRKEVWAPVVKRLSLYREVIAVDLPGFGDTPLDAITAVSVANYAARLTEFLGDLGIDRPEVGGNSMGGGIAFELGRLGVAEKVTAFSPIGFWTPAERRWCQASMTSLRMAAKVAQRPMAWGARYRPVRYAGLRLVFGQPASVTPEEAMLTIDGGVHASGFASSVRCFADYDLRDPAQDWGKLRDIPVTVAWGDKDFLTRYRTQSVRARAALPWARHVTLPGSGHTPFYDDPALCVRILLGTDGS